MADVAAHEIRRTEEQLLDLADIEEDGGDQARTCGCQQSWQLGIQAGLSEDTGPEAPHLGAKWFEGGVRNSGTF